MDGSLCQITSYTRTDDSCNSNNGRHLLRAYPVPDTALSVHLNELMEMADHLARHIRATWPVPTGTSTPSTPVHQLGVSSTVCLGKSFLKTIAIASYAPPESA